MLRTLNVSTEVFAAIWANRHEGEETEDEILCRILGCQSSAKNPGEPFSTGIAGGLHDHRNGVSFAEGFEIFRTYKGQEYRATASGGAWVRKDNGQRFTTLNQLNSSIAAGAENVWNGNWKYRTPEGSVRSIADLRR